MSRERPYIIVTLASTAAVLAFFLLPIKVSFPDLLYAYQIHHITGLIPDMLLYAVPVMALWCVVGLFTDFNGRRRLPYAGALVSGTIGILAYLSYFIGFYCEGYPLDKLAIGFFAGLGALMTAVYFSVGALNISELDSDFLGGLAARFFDADGPGFSLRERALILALFCSLSAVGAFFMLPIKTAPPAPYAFQRLTFGSFEGTVLLSVPMLVVWGMIALGLVRRDHWRLAFSGFAVLSGVGALAYISLFIELWKQVVPAAVLDAQAATETMNIAPGLMIAFALLLAVLAVSIIGLFLTDAAKLPVKGAVSRSQG